MIVIADDLTGAAEMGGAAHRYGMPAEIVFKSVPKAGERLAVVATDTRNLPPAQAAAAVASLVRGLEPGLKSRIYKKVDSVLRGPVVAEISALMKSLGLSRALLLPCNPAAGRTIQSGKYWVGGRPIHETDFRNDPDYPAHSPEVLELLRPQPGAPEVRVLPLDAELPASGIIVGEAASPDEVKAWAERLDTNTLPAGAAEFFAAILERDGWRPQPPSGGKPDLSGTLFLVSGSAAAQSREQIQALESRGMPILRMPQPLFDGDPGERRLIDDWAEQAVQELTRHGRVGVWIGRPVSAAVERSTRLSRCLGGVTLAVLARVPAEHLWVDGGATASALVQRLGWNRLEVHRELAPGAVQVRPAGRQKPLLLMKPGSYAWPALA